MPGCMLHEGNTTPHLVRCLVATPARGTTVNLNHAHRPPHSRLGCTPSRLNGGRPNSWRLESAQPSGPESRDFERDTQTTQRIGFRHGSVATARTYKRPESALSKITFRAGRSRASQTPRAPDATGAHRRNHRGAAGRASPASHGRRSVRTAAAKGQKPTICGLVRSGQVRFITRPKSRTMRAKRN